jgi:2-polyprenyl-3-methyl-5-hydroxy-6-metoxy-1,4-benzoquinol methylase
MDCPACNAPDKTLLSEKDATALPIETSICMACGLVYASRRLDDQSLAEFYRNENLRLDRGVDSAERMLFELETGKGELIFNFLKERGFLERLRDTQIVEIGCGAGGILSYFRIQGFAVQGFDIDPAVVGFGQSQGLPLHLGGVAQARAICEKAGKPVGLIIYEQVLEHLIDPAAELAEAKALITPETLLFIGVPGLRNIRSHYRSDILNYLQPGHILHFEEVTLTRMLRALGFAPVVTNELIYSVFQLDAAPEMRAEPLRPVARAMIAFLSDLEEERVRQTVVPVPFSLDKMKRWARAAGRRLLRRA